MPNISLPEAMQDYAERQVNAGIYANLSEVVRAGLEEAMDEDGATAFYLMRRDLATAAAEPTEESTCGPCCSTRRPEPRCASRQAAGARRPARDPRWGEQTCTHVTSSRG